MIIKTICLFKKEDELDYKSLGLTEPKNDYSNSDIETLYIFKDKIVGFNKSGIGEGYLTLRTMDGTFIIKETIQSFLIKLGE